MDETVRFLQKNKRHAKRGNTSFGASFGCIIQGVCRLAVCHGVTSAAKRKTVLFFPPVSGRKDTT